MKFNTKKILSLLFFLSISANCIHAMDLPNTDQPIFGEDAPPIDYDAIADENANLKNMVARLNTRNTELTTTVTDLNVESTGLKNNIKDLNTENTELKSGHLRSTLIGTVVGTLFTSFICVALPRIYSYFYPPTTTSNSDSSKEDTQKLWDGLKKRMPVIYENPNNTIEDLKTAEELKRVMFEKNYTNAGLTMLIEGLDEPTEKNNQPTNNRPSLKTFIDKLKHLNEITGNLPEQEKLSRKMPSELQFDPNDTVETKIEKWKRDLYMGPISQEDYKNYPETLKMVRERDNLPKITPAIYGCFIECLLPKKKTLDEYNRCENAAQTQARAAAYQDNKATT